MPFIFTQEGGDKNEVEYMCRHAFPYALAHFIKIEFTYTFSFALAHFIKKSSHARAHFPLWPGTFHQKIEVPHVCTRARALFPLCLHSSLKRVHIAFSKIEGYKRGDKITVQSILQNIGHKKTDTRHAVISL